MIKCECFVTFDFPFQIFCFCVQQIEKKNTKNRKYFFFALFVFGKNFLSYLAFLRNKKNNVTRRIMPVVFEIDGFYLSAVVFAI